MGVLPYSIKLMLTIESISVVTGVGMLVYFGIFFVGVAYNLLMIIIEVIYFVEC